MEQTNESRDYPDRKPTPTKTGHTPGPWETNYTGNIWGDVDNPKHDGDNPLLAKVEMWDASPYDEEAKANAALIAAAPETKRQRDDLLATLKEVETTLSVLYAKRTDGGPAILNMVRANIARAEE